MFILFSRHSSRIALDVLHPCTYLWVEKSKLKPDKAAKLTWSQALVNGGWWALQFNNLILNETVTGLMKWLGPAWFVLMPFLTLFMPYIGVNQAFMMIGSTTNRWEAERDESDMVAAGSHFSQRLTCKRLEEASRQNFVWLPLAVGLIRNNTDTHSIAIVYPLLTETTWDDREQSTLITWRSQLVYLHVSSKKMFESMPQTSTWYNLYESIYQEPSSKQYSAFRKSGVSASFETVLGAVAEAAPERSEAIDLGTHGIANRSKLL